MIIKTHKPNDTYVNENHFFVPSRGTNAGKPMLDPSPNCFVLISRNYMEKEYFYWLCSGLWAGGFFRPFSLNAVVLFFRIQDISVPTIQSKIALRRKALFDALIVLKKINAHQILVILSHLLLQVNFSPL